MEGIVMIEVIDCRKGSFKHQIQQVEAIEKSFRLLAKRKGSWTYFIPLSLQIDPRDPELEEEKMPRILSEARRLAYDHKVIIIQNFAISIIAS
jgi:hypothetical protein